MPQARIAGGEGPPQQRVRPGQKNAQAARHGSWALFCVEWATLQPKTPYDAAQGVPGGLAGHPWPQAGLANVMP